MFTVALIGPDGAGKTTIGRRLERTLTLPIKYLYMGVNAASSNYLLPTTWLVRAVRASRGAQCAVRSARPDELDPPRTAHCAPRTASAASALSALWSALRLANRVGEEWFRQGLAWYY